jgi:thiosulfate/3-mercaptopyruvate sulfurtransferase
MFRAFGHTNSSVLNGGLLRWISEGYAVENSAPAEVQPTQYPTPALDASLLRGMFWFHSQRHLLIRDRL